MRTVFDTETTGLRRKGVALGDPSQPRIAQLAASVYDAKWRKLQSFAVYIKPDGWTIEPGAERVNGISDAMCHKYGVPIIVALALFQSFVESTMQIVGHSVQFDREMVEHELMMIGADPLWLTRKAHAFVDTQQIAKNICQLPGKFGDFKFPSLGEAITIVCPGRPFTATHEAGHDVDETAALAQGLDAKGLLPIARIRHEALEGEWRSRL